MAVIGKIRKHSVILLVIVATALLAFIVGDLKKPSNKIASNFIKVGKSKVSYMVYQDKYDYYCDLIKRQNKATTLTHEEEFQLRENIYNEFVDSITLYNQLNALGITLTSDELRDLVAGEEPNAYARRFFSDENGNYSSQLAQGFLDNMSQYDTNVVKAYLDLEKYIEKESIQNKYFNLLSKAAYTPKAILAMNVEEEATKADVRMVQVSYNNPLVAEDKIGKCTDEEVQKWYEENKYRFKQEEEWRNIEYVIFPIEPSVSDLKNIEENFRASYEEFLVTDEPQKFVAAMPDSRYDSTYYRMGELTPGIDTLLFNAPIGTFVEPFVEGEYWMFAKLLDREVRPDSINVSFMFVSNMGTQEFQRKESESKKIVDSAYRELMSGMDFYDVALNRSDIPIAQQPDSGRVWIADGSDQQMFFDTLYRHANASIVKIDYPAGTYIFKVNDHSEANVKIQLALGRKQILASSETVDNIESSANVFVNGVTTYEQFDKKIVAEKMNRRSFERVTAMSYNIPGLDASSAREVVRWAYDKETEKGNVSKVFSFNDMFVVAVLKDIYPEGYAPLEMVRTYAETMVTRDKKAEKLQKAIDAQLAKSTDLNQMASRFESKVDTLSICFADRNIGNYGAELGVIGGLFGRKIENKVGVYKGEMGVYVIMPSKFIEPSAMGADASMNERMNALAEEQIRMQLNRVQQGLSMSLRKMYKISDHRADVF